jgi:hypothetical protein
MGTIITKPGGTQVGYKGFKYNVTYYYGYFPPAVPTTGQIVVIFYDNGEGGADYGGISINYYTADNVYVGDIVQKIANQNVTITDSTGKYVVIPSNGTFTNFGTYSRIDTPYAYGNVDISALSGVVYAEFGTSNTGTVSNVSALTLTSSGTNLTSTVTNSTTTPVITLNVPNASATNRGALTTTDWSAFNAKQEALVSGTNIKTINGASVLGSGNINVGGLTVYRSTTGTTLGTLGAYQLSNSVLIPANTVSSPSTIEFKARFIISSVNAGRQVFGAFYINTSNTLTGATAMASFGELGSATSDGYTVTRTMTVSGVIGTLLRAGLSIQDDYTNAGGILGTVNFNTTVNQYIICAMFVQGTGTSAVCPFVAATIY